MEYHAFMIDHTVFSFQLALYNSSMLGGLFKLPFLLSPVVLSYSYSLESGELWLLEEYCLADHFILLKTMLIKRECVGYRALDKNGYYR